MLRSIIFEPTHHKYNTSSHMHLLFPTYLWGLIFLSIPIIIHLFSFKRYKTVYFSNVRFLKSVQTQTKKKHTLKRLLMLLCRLLALAAIILAFAQPYLAPKAIRGKASSQAVGIYIDNSFSMEATSTEGVLLERAKQKATTLVQSYPSSTPFFLVTNELALRDQFPYNRYNLLTRISEIGTTARKVTMSAIQNHFTEIAKTEPDAPIFSIFYFSDFQTPFANIEELQPDTSWNHTLIQLQPNERTNRSIDTAWFEIPGHRKGQKEQLFFTVKNQSDQPVQNLPVRLFVNDSLRALANINIAPGETSESSFNFQSRESGLKQARIELADYPITYDNTLYMGYEVLEKLKVLVISTNEESEKYLKALFADDELITPTFSRAGKVKMSELNNYHTIFMPEPADLSSGLATLLQSFVAGGGSLVMTPGSETSRPAVNALLNALGVPLYGPVDSTRMPIKSIATRHQLFSNVFREAIDMESLPEILLHFPLSGNNRSNSTPLIKLANGDWFLSQTNVANGKVFLFASPFSASAGNFVTHGLFVPGVYNIALNSVPASTHYFTVGERTPLNLFLNAPLPDNELPRLVKREQEHEFLPRFERLPGNRLRLFTNGLEQAGNYTLTSGSKQLKAIAFNSSREESTLQFLTSEELTNAMKRAGISYFTQLNNPEGNFADTIGELNNGKSLWRYFVLFAILALLAEVLISRFTGNIPTKKKAFTQ